jgi:X-X-X-Leu-X-X-Gly heptad repeat protein
MDEENNQIQKVADGIQKVADGIQKVADGIENLSDLRYLPVPEIQQRYGVSRKDARELIRIAHAEQEEDNKAYAPSGTDYLEDRLNTGINRELDRLLLEQAELEGVIRAAGAPGHAPGQKFDGPHGVAFNRQEAAERLEIIFSRIMEIRKAIVPKNKDKGAGVNIEFNMGQVVGDALSNIKSADYEQMD